MHGSRPDLFQLRQLIFAAVIITGAIAILAGVALFSASHGFPHSAAMSIAIAKMELGAPPAGFQFARTGQGDLGRWIVVSDETSSAGRAIEQSSTDRTDYRFPLAILDSIVAKNVDVSLKFKPVAGHVDHPDVSQLLSSRLRVLVPLGDQRVKVRGREMQKRQFLDRRAAPRSDELPGRNQGRP